MYHLYKFSGIRYMIVKEVEKTDPTHIKAEVEEILYAIDDTYPKGTIQTFYNGYLIDHHEDLNTLRDIAYLTLL